MATKVILRTEPIPAHQYTPSALKAARYLLGILQIFARTPAEFAEIQRIDAAILSNDLYLVMAALRTARAGKTDHWRQLHNGWLAAVEYSILKDIPNAPETPFSAHRNKAH